MSTSRRQSGFTLLELLVALSIAAVLTASAGLLFLALTSRASAESDGIVSYLQGRVAVARFERDLRLASAGGCLFGTAGPILEAGPSQIVFLRRDQDSATPIVVEWEISSGALMRRWGVCPSSRPKTFPHSLYRDNKTMLGGVNPGSCFVYLLDDGSMVSQVPESQLYLINLAKLALTTSSDGLAGHVVVTAEARIGR